MNGQAFMNIFIWLLPADFLFNGFSAHVEEIISGLARIKLDYSENSVVGIPTADATVTQTMVGSFPEFSTK